MKGFTPKTGKWIFLLTILMLGAFLTNVHAQPIKVDKSKWPKKISLAVGPIGSHGFLVGSTWAPVINKELGLNIAVENTGGAVHNCKLVAAGTVGMGMSYMGIALDGWEGKAKWADNKKLRSFRVWAVEFPMATYFYTLKKSGIEKLQDLNGKVVSLNRLGSGSNLWGNLIFKELGIKPKRIATVSPSDSNNLLRDGGIDAALCQGTPPHPAIAELSTTQDIHVISFSPKERDQLMKKFPKLMKPYTVPAGTYKGQDKPILTLTDYEVFLVNTSVPDDMMYMVTKTFWEKHDELIKKLAKFKLVKAEDIVKSPVPISRGAYLYYKEIGIKIPEDIMPVN
jgi:TRAP transporter TAXI family solute receptor